MHHFIHIRNDGDMNDLWNNSLKLGIQSILKKDVDGLSFERLYRACFEMVRCRYGENLYRRTQEVITEHLIQKVQQDVVDSLNNNFLETLNISWNYHRSAISMIRDILMPMNRVYVSAQNLEPVYNLGAILFRDNIVRYPPIRDHLTQTLLDMAAEERRGELIDTNALTNTCQMLVKLNIDSCNVYKEIFETPLLSQILKLAQMENQRLSIEEKPSVYISILGTFMNEQTKGNNQYLDETSKDRILRIFDDELFTKNSDLLKKHSITLVETENSGIYHMLEFNKYDDLSSMYTLLKPIKMSHSIMLDYISNHLRKQGDALITENSENVTDPLAYIQSLIDFKDIYDMFLKNSFHNDQIFAKRIHSDFEYFINLNQHTPEYLSLFIDDKLKKDNKEIDDQQVECVLNKAVGLVPYLQEKDIFERYYKRHLAKRLLLHKLVTDDAEKTIISILKTIYHYSPFVHVIERMFKDVSISNTLIDDFRIFVKQEQIDLNGVDLFVQVLTTDIWPIKRSYNQCHLPTVVQEVYQCFRSFYLNKHSGRQLTLQPSLGSVDLTSIFYGEPRPTTTTTTNKERKYILQVSTYQMIILMLFNTKESWTFEEIHHETDINEKDLQRALLSLTMGKLTQQIIIKEPKTKEIQSSDRFSINDTFTSKSYRVKINPIKVETESHPQRQETRNKVEDDRKHEIDAAIVRIMKTRNTMSHTQLVAEVTQQLKARFMPSPGFIKKQIEILIERDYLSRRTDDRNMYNYVAFN